MAFFRWLLGLPVAAAITVGLFFFMAGLIRQGDVELGTEKPVIDLTITAQREDTKFTREELRTKIPEKAPETILDFDRKSGDPDPVRVDPTPFKVDPDPPGPEGVAIGPVITIAPPYPEGCRTKGAEGIVIVEFDISPEGNVMNPRVIESPDRCFDRPIIRAVSGWKYPPSRDGRMRYGAVQQFKFELEG